MDSKTTHTLNKNEITEMDTPVEQILNDFFNEHFNSMIWIKSTQDLRKSSEETGLDNLVIPDMMPKTSVLAGRYETDINRAYIRPKVLKQWCVGQQINYAQLFIDLKEKLGAKKQKLVTKAHY